MNLAEIQIGLGIAPEASLAETKSACEKSLAQAREDWESKGFGSLPERSPVRRIQKQRISELESFDAELRAVIDQAGSQTKGPTPGPRSTVPKEVRDFLGWDDAKEDGSDAALLELEERRKLTAFEIARIEGTRNPQLRRYKSDLASVNELIASLRPNPPPAKPKLTASVDQPGGVNLAWTVPSGAVACEIHRSETAGSGSVWARIAGDVKSPYIDTVCDYGRGYYYKVGYRAPGKDELVFSDEGRGYRPKIKLPSPQKVTARAVKQCLAALSWESAGYGKGVEIRRSSSPAIDETGKATAAIPSDKPLASWEDPLAGPTLPVYYAVRVVGGDETEPSLWAVSNAIWTWPPPPPPEKPKLTASLDRPGGVELRWTVPSGSVGFELHRSETAGSGGTWSPIAKNANSPFVDTGCGIGRDYYYKVGYRLGGGEERVFSDEKRGYCPRVIDPQIIKLPDPQRVTARAVKREIAVLGWESAGLGAGVEIRRSSSPKIDETGETTASIPSDKPLASWEDLIVGPALPVYYWVRVVGGAGTEPSSWVVSNAIVTWPAPPEKPRPTASLDRPDGVKLTWKVPRGAGGCEVHRSDTAGPAQTWVRIAEKSKSSHIDTGCDFARDYYYKVGYLPKGGTELVFSDDIRGHRPRIKLTGPRKVAARVKGQGLVVLSWKSSGLGKSVEIRRSCSPDRDDTGQPTASIPCDKKCTCWDDQQAGSALPVYYWLRVVGEGGTESSPWVVSNAILTWQIPEPWLTWKKAVLLILLSAGLAALWYNWSRPPKAVITVGVGEVRGIEVKVSDRSPPGSYHIIRTDPNGPPKEINVIKPGESWLDVRAPTEVTTLYRIIAVTPSGVTNAFGPFERLRPEVDLPKPEIVTGALTAEGIRLSWTPVPGSHGYQILRTVDGRTGGTNAFSTGNTTNFDDVLAAEDSNVRYSVKAFRNAGNGSPKPGKAAETGEYSLRPERPQIRSSGVDGRSAQIVWADVAESTLYRVRSGLNGGFAKTNEVATNRYSLEIATPDTEMHVQVQAVRAKWSGDWSDSLKLTRKKINVGTIANPKYKKESDGRTTLTWDEVANAQHYSVYDPVTKISRSLVRPRYEAQLPPFGKHTFKVKAEGEDGSGAETEVSVDQGELSLPPTPKPDWAHNNSPGAELTFPEAHLPEGVSLLLMRLPGTTMEEAEKAIGIRVGVVPAVGGRLTDGSAVSEATNFYRVEAVYQTNVVARSSIVALRPQKAPSPLSKGTPTVDGSKPALIDSNPTKGGIERGEIGNTLVPFKKYDENTYLGLYEVTVAQFRSIMGWVPVGFSVTEFSDYPVANVSRDEAIEFCGRLERLMSKEGSLPLKFHCTLPDRAIYFKMANRFGGNAIGLHGIYREDGKSSAQLIGRKGPDPMGYYDLFGNVSEWTSTPDGPNRFFISGGNWKVPAGSPDAIARAVQPTTKEDSIGFRVALVRETP